MAQQNLVGKRIAILAADGVEEVELVQPRAAVEDAGATTRLISLKSGQIQAMNHDVEKGDTFSVDSAVADCSPDDFDALLLPGGTTNPDNAKRNIEIANRGPLPEAAVKKIREAFTRASEGKWPGLT